jgi:hypothetical protein
LINSSAIGVEQSQGDPCDTSWSQLDGCATQLFAQCHQDSASLTPAALCFYAFCFKFLFSWMQRIAAGRDLTGSGSYARITVFHLHDLTQIAEIHDCNRARMICMFVFPLNGCAGRCTATSPERAFDRWCWEATLEYCARSRQTGRMIFSTRFQR